MRKGEFYVSFEDPDDNETAHRALTIFCLQPNTPEADRNRAAELANYMLSEIDRGRTPSIATQDLPLVEASLITSFQHFMRLEAWYRQQTDMPPEDAILRRFAAASCAFMNFALLEEIVDTSSPIGL